MRRRAVTATKATSTGRSARPGAGAAAEAPLQAAYYVFGPAEGEVLWLYLTDRLRDRLRRMAGPDLTVVRLDGPGAWQAAASEGRTRALAGSRLILAQPEGAPGDGAGQALARALAQPAPGVTLAVREPVLDGRRRDAAMTDLRASAAAIEAAALDRRAAAAFVAQAGQAMGLAWGPGAAAFLFGRVGEDPLLAWGELAKYRDILAPGAALDRTAIERLTPLASAARVYPVGDAYLAGDLAGALRTAHAAMDAGESAFGLAGFLGRQAHLLAQAHAYAAACRERGERLEGEGLAAAIGVRPWQARPLLGALGRGRPDPAGAPTALVVADLELKSGMPVGLAVDRLLMALLAG